MLISPIVAFLSHEKAQYEKENQFINFEWSSIFFKHPLNKMVDFLLQVRKVTLRYSNNQQHKNALILLAFMEPYILGFRNMSKLFSPRRYQAWTIQNQ